MALVYGAVARGAAVLSEYSLLAGNFGSVARDCLARAPAAGGRSTHAVDGHVFFLLGDGSYSERGDAGDGGGRSPTPRPDAGYSSRAARRPTRLQAQAVYRAALRRRGSGRRRSCAGEGRVRTSTRARAHTLPVLPPPPDYVVVGSEAAGRAVPNAVLDRLKEDFLAK
jgi:hypothetical protein